MDLIGIADKAMTEFFVGISAGFAGLLIWSIKKLKDIPRCDSCPSSSFKKDLELMLAPIKLSLETNNAFIKDVNNRFWQHITGTIDLVALWRNSDFEDKDRLLDELIESHKDIDTIIAERLAAKRAAGQTKGV